MAATPDAPIKGHSAEHDLAFDPDPGWIGLRWTCRRCCCAVLAEEGNVYGSAVDEGCLPNCIEVPCPHVPCGPVGIPVAEATASALSGAAYRIAGGYPPGGSHATAAVVKLLRDAADALREAML